MVENAVEESLQRARGLLREGQAEGAAAVLRGVLRQQPGNPRAAHLLGVVRALQGDLTGALVELVRALQTDPRNPEILHCLGSVWYEGGNYDEARRCHQDALANRPGHPEYLAGLARAELGLEHLDEAARLMQEAVQAAPESTAHLRLLAEILLASGRAAESLPLWEQLVQRDPGDASASEWLEVARGEASGGAGEGAGPDLAPSPVGADAGMSRAFGFGRPASAAFGAGPVVVSGGGPRACVRCGAGNSLQSRVCSGCGAQLALFVTEDAAPENLLLSDDGGLQVAPSMAEASVEDALRTASSDFLEGRMEAEEYLGLVDRMEEAVTSLYEGSQEMLLRDLRASFMRDGRARGRDAAWLAAQEETVLAAHEEAYGLFCEAWNCLRRLAETADATEVETAVEMAREAMGRMASLDVVGAAL